MLGEAARRAVTVARRQGLRRRALGGAVRALGITPHVAQKDAAARSTGARPDIAGYAISQRKRKLIEQVFGWMKTVGGLRKLRHRGGGSSIGW